MKYRYTEREAEFLESMGLPFNFRGELNDDQCVEMWEAIEDQLQMYGLTEDGENEFGTLCGNLLASLARQEDAENKKEGNNGEDSIH